MITAFEEDFSATDCTRFALLLVEKCEYLDAPFTPGERKHELDGFFELIGQRLQGL